MSRRSVGFRVDEDLWGRVESRAAELGQSKTTFLERALERALGPDVTQARHEAVLRDAEKDVAAMDRLAAREAEKRPVEPPRTEPQLFKCPACQFRAPSPNAICPSHGSKVR